MAELETKITVSVERAIHLALIDIAQTIWDEHKIKLDRVYIDWLDFSGVDGRKCFVNGVSVDSQSFASERPWEES